MIISNKPMVHIIGGGLAGCEAAWQCLRQGRNVKLYEMRPHQQTGAHKTGNLAELVCSNSFKSLKIDCASGQLKYEMEQLDSLIMLAAKNAAVPAGDALAVDRELFSKYIEDCLGQYPGFQLERQEVDDFTSIMNCNDNADIWVLAAGPLCSERLMAEIMKASDTEHGSYFYDAIAPTILADSIDPTKVFWSNRWQPEGSDYLNIPLTQEQYLDFVEAIRNAQKVPLQPFEEQRYFESCLPIEVMVDRGVETLRFGPMKPVGLVDPHSNLRPYAAIQLRKENLSGTMLNMVGFQTKMTWSEQRRVFQSLPGLEKAEFLRFGSIHRNSYLNSPTMLQGDLSFKSNPRVLAAGQITGVEGYLESCAMGLLAGRVAAARLEHGIEFLLPPATTIMGALLHHVAHGTNSEFQPMNANLGILPPLQKLRGEGKNQRKSRQILHSKAEFDKYFESLRESCPQS